MNARALTSPSPQRPNPVRGLALVPDLDRPTCELGAGDDIAIAAAEVVDHRTRQHAVPFALARRGHHLAIDLDDDELLPLSERVTHVGRGRLAQVRVEDARVSRDHAILVVHGDHLRLLDNRSASGTYVNGQCVSAVTLRDGDVIGLGPVEFRYRWIDPARSRSRSRR